jgi:hypothetical protein
MQAGMNVRVIIDVNEAVLNKILYRAMLDRFQLVSFRRSNPDADSSHFCRVVKSSNLTSRQFATLTPVIFVR